MKSKKAKQNLVAMMLSVIMVVSVMPISVQAETSTLAPMTLTAGSSSEVYALLKEDGSIVEATSDGSEIPGGTAVEKTTVTHLFVAEHVIAIADSAFKECANLTSVDLSNASSLQIIENSAFYMCTSLVSVNFANATALERIGEKAFYNVSFTSTNLSAATNLSTIEKMAFYGAKLTQITIPEQITTIAEDVFGNTKLTSVTISENITEIRAGAFAYCPDLETVDLSNAVALQTIGDFAFVVCPSLNTIDLSSATALQTIGEETFGACTSLTSIEIPQTVTSIGNIAFSGCEKLRSVTFESVLPPTTIGTTIFDECAALTAIYVPNGSADAYKAVTNLGAYNTLIQSHIFAILTNTGLYPASESGVQEGNTAIIDRSTVTHLFVDENVIEIADSAFKECVNLISVDFSNASALQTIGDYAFERCTSLVSVDFSNATELQTIEFHAFIMCTSLVSMDFSNAVALQTIEEGAFARCASLESVDFSNATELQTIGEVAFFECSNLRSITIPAKVATIGNGAFYKCTALTSVDLSNVARLESIGYLVFSEAGLTEITIPAKVTSIDERAFIGCTALTSVDLSKAEELQTIGDAAFLQTGLTEITIPAKVTKIGNSAFQLCGALTTVIFTGTVPPTTVGTEIFRNCTALTNIYVPRDSVTSYINTENLDAYQDKIKANPAFIISFDANSGSITPSWQVADEDGKLTNLPTPTKSGRYQFIGWYTEKTGGTKISADTVFTEDTTIYAQWTYTGGGGSSGGDNSDGGGTVTPPSYEITEGDAQTITNMESGASFRFDMAFYNFRGIQVDGKAIEAEHYTAKSGSVILELKPDFLETLAKGKHTLTVIGKDGGKASAYFYIETHENPQKGVGFTDVKETAWFYHSVINAVEKGWFRGTSDSTFSPYLDTTRGMIVSILYRMEDGAAKDEIMFSDVKAESYYADAVYWATENKIVGGYGNGLFGPNNAVTREQLVTILYNYANFKGYDTSKTAPLYSFTDGNTVSGYATDAMSWAVGNGLISGKGNNILDPKAGATRAEVAPILTRFDSLFTENKTV